MSEKDQKQLVVAHKDEKFEQKVRQVAADQKTFNKALEIAEETFQKLYGEKPNHKADIWLWFVTEVYDTFLRLSLTKSGNS